MLLLRLEILMDIATATKMYNRALDESGEAVVFHS